MKSRNGTEEEFRPAHYMIRGGRLSDRSMHALSLRGFHIAIPPPSVRNRNARDKGLRQTRKVKAAGNRPGKMLLVLIGGKMNKSGRQFSF
jgi:hypothetical protein